MPLRGSRRRAGRRARLCGCRGRRGPLGRLLVTRPANRTGRASRACERARGRRDQVADAAGCPPGLGGLPSHAAATARSWASPGSTGKTTTKDFVTAALFDRQEGRFDPGQSQQPAWSSLTVLQPTPPPSSRRRDGHARARPDRRALPDRTTDDGPDHQRRHEPHRVARQSGRRRPGEGEILRCLGPDGAASSTETTSTPRGSPRTTAATITLYGLSEGCAVRAEDIELDAESRASFVLVAEASGVSRPAWRAGPPQRLQRRSAPAPSRFTWASPPRRSPRACRPQASRRCGCRFSTPPTGSPSLTTPTTRIPLRWRPRSRPSRRCRPKADGVAVLGDMAELGSLTELAHFQVGSRSHFGGSMCS